MTPSPGRPTLRADSPAELLAMVPYLLGFHPTSSIVIVALNGPAILNVARLDLPSAPDLIPPMTAVLSRVAATMNTSGATSAILIGYGTAEQVAPAARAATTALADLSMPVQQTLRVNAGRYWSDINHNPGGYPPDGTSFDFTASVAAATATAYGLVALPSRAALAARLDPVTGAARERMVNGTANAAQFLVDLIEAVAPEANDHPDTPLDASTNTALQQALRDTGHTHLTQARRQYQTGTPVDDEQAGLITVLLDLQEVRELAARSTTAANWEIDMWVDLVRRAEPEFVVGPAIMLTLCALRAGNGPLAAIAVQRALEADPTDQLAQLIQEFIIGGVDPATVTALLSS